MIFDRIKKVKLDRSGDIQRFGLYIIAFVALLSIEMLVGKLILGRDITYVACWVGSSFVLGAGVMPLCAYVFGRFTDKGYIFGRIIGLCTAGYVMWLFASVRLLEFTRINSYISLFLVALIVYITLGIYNRKKRIGLKSLFEEIKGIVATAMRYELAILALMILFTWLFGHRIPSTETERLMDFALMNSIDKCRFFPALDMWAAGNSVNYYYFGHYLMTYLSKMAGVGVERGYSLAMAFILSYSICGVFSLARELIVKNGIPGRVVSSIGGMISVLFVCFAGNMHYVIYGKIAPVIKDVLGLEQGTEYSFTNSTRYIGYYPFVEEDRTITEMPWYSLLVGDLHAHVLGMLISITLLAILFAAIINMYERKEKSRSFHEQILNPYLIIFAFLVSISSMTNYWDYPIYFVVGGGIFLFGNIYQAISSGHISGDDVVASDRRHAIGRAVLITGLQGAVAYVVINIMNLPFRMNFEMMESGIAISKYHSKFYQYMVLWGIPLTLLILFIIFLLTYKRKDTGVADIYIVLTGLCGMGLTILPELIYVKDIYEAGFPRANTMFKLTFAAFIILGVMMGYVLVSILNAGYRYCNDHLGTMRLFLIRILVVIAGVFLAGSVMYTYDSIKQWYITPGFDQYITLDSMDSVKELIGKEYAAVEYLKENADYGDVCVVVPGDSYSMRDVIPVLANCSTPLGWRVHEWLWHNSRNFITEREEDVRELYTGTDMDIKRNILKKYDVKYIYIGSKEYEEYGYIDASYIVPLGFVVYSDNHEDFPSMIIKIE